MKHVFTRVAALALPVIASILIACVPRASSAQLPSFIPMPVSMTVTGGEFRLTRASRIVPQDDSLKPLASVLQGEIDRTTGLRLSIGSGFLRPGDIGIGIDGGPKDVAYRLTISDRAMISGGNDVAAALGTATLLQAIGVTGHPVIPRMVIADRTDRPYRAALLDLGRKYHTIEGVEQVVELCRLYKIRFLQLHLSDDQLFMFPSAAFPHLGAGNHEFARFDPPSTDEPIRPYTIEQLRGLENYSRDRGVSIVPELDLPGHSSRLTGDAPETFLATPENGGTINFASARTIAAATTLLDEVMDVFRSTPYIHLGGDEVWEGGLDTVPDFKNALQEFHLSSIHSLYRKFVSAMNDVINKRGKRMVVWEEAFSPDQNEPYPLPKNAVILVWSLNASPQAMLDQGYDIVNGSWTPLYIVRDDKRPVEFIYNWHMNQFGAHPSVFNGTWTTAKTSSHFLGAQLSSWENPESEEIQSLRARLAAVAERTWRDGQPDNLPYSDFTARLAHTDALVEKLVDTVTITSSKSPSADENMFDAPIWITLKAAGPQLRIHYTLDNRMPTAASPLYAGRFEIQKSAWIRAAAFTPEGERRGDVSGAWFRRTTKFIKNLATGKPVTVTNPESDTSPQVAVDGDVNVERHWAGKTPSSLTVDLQKSYTIDHINLLTYYDGSRYYQYTIETSTDGKEWRTVADGSKNTATATPEGYDSRFAPTAARYVRVNMLKNSANPGTHIVELSVFEAKKR